MKRTLIILGSLVTIATIGGYTFLRFLNTPTSATSISTGTMKPASSKQSLFLGNPIAIASTYASFSYPSIFSIQKTQPITGNIVAEYSYEYRTLIPWQLSITITFLPANEINSDSAYYAMSQNPTRYSKSTVSSNGNQVVVFTDTTTGGFSKSAFLFHSSYSADISLTSDDGQHLSQEQDALMRVVQSWQWK